MDDMSRRYGWLSWVPVVALLLALVAVVVVYFAVSGTPLYKLTVVAGYAVLILLFFFGLIVLFAMATGRIDLSLLLSEAGGGASMSRFQLLIFTFLIAFSLFLMIVSSGPPLKFPAIPSEILMLLGISASTYAVSKGIQSSSPSMTKKATGTTTTTVQTPPDGSTTTTVQTPTTGQTTTTVQTPDATETRTTVQPPNPE